MAIRLGIVGTKWVQSGLKGWKVTEDVLDQINSFRGSSEHGLDSKGRLNIPARFKDVLTRKYDDRLLITPWRKCLRIYPLAEWAKIELAILGRGQQNAKTAKLVRHLVGNSCEVQLDNNGRILLPVSLRSMGAIDKEVVLLGMTTFIEVWDKQVHLAENVVGEEEFDELAGECSDLGFF